MQRRRDGLVVAEITDSIEGFKDALDLDSSENILVAVLVKDHDKVTWFKGEARIVIDPSHVANSMRSHGSPEGIFVDIYGKVGEQTKNKHDNGEDDDSSNHGFGVHR